MPTTLRLYVITFVSFLALDSVWLGVVSPRFYKQHIGHLLADHPNWYAAALFYLIFIGGLMYFAVAPAVAKNSVSTGALRGAIFGLVTYATFDLTSQAMLRNWPAIVTIIDLLWGTALSSATSALTVFLHQKLSR